MREVLSPIHFHISHTITLIRVEHPPSRTASTGYSTSQLVWGALRYSFPSHLQSLFNLEVRPPPLKQLHTRNIYDAPLQIISHNHIGRHWKLSHSAAATGYSTSHTSLKGHFALLHHPIINLPSIILDIRSTLATFSNNSTTSQLDGRALCSSFSFHTQSTSNHLSTHSKRPSSPNDYDDNPNHNCITQ